MVAQVKSWGNSQGIRLSRELLDSIGVHVNDMLKVEVKNGDIILSKTFKHKTLEERAAEYNGKIGPYEEYDWGEPQGRELW